MTYELFRILKLQSAWQALSTTRIRWNQMRNKQNWLSVITFVPLRSNQKQLTYTVLNVTNRSNINVDIRKHSGKKNSLESVFLSGKNRLCTMTLFCPAEGKLHALTTILPNMQSTQL